MWLLSTDRAELHFFSDPSSIPVGYAILSHTWNEDGELSFQDIRAIIKRSKLFRRNPRNHVSPKIRNCCMQAQRDGYAWVWIDTCCIDKTSSTELSEAINSMFTWYVHAEVCYALLEDVASGDVVYSDNSDFRKARWHTRGWTLQELLAPSIVIFMSRDWTQLGTKNSLANLLESITGIHRAYSTRQQNFRTTAIATRMKWASRRRTTRVEDEAYCLLGLFGINMPTIYGEGARAFQRLQEEIVRRSFDTTLFAWGHACHTLETHLIPRPLEEFRAHAMDGEPMAQDGFLFAPSPRQFWHGGALFYTPGVSNPLQPYVAAQWASQGLKQPEKGPFGLFELPSFEVTHYGMKCRFPAGEVDQLTIAVFFCETPFEYVGLILHPCSGNEVQDPLRPLYRVGWEFTDDNVLSDSMSRYVRLVLLGNDYHNLRFRGKTFHASWRDIYIVNGGQRDGTDVLINWAPDGAPAYPFRVPRALVRAFEKLGFHANSSRVDSMPSNRDGGEDANGGDPESGHTVVLFKSVHAAMGEGFTIHLGLCSQQPTRKHWALAIIGGASDDQNVLHNCAKDHIDDWPRWSRDFGDSRCTVRLTFSRCVHHPETTRVLDVELRGEAHRQLMESSHEEGDSTSSRVFGEAPAHGEQGNSETMSHSDSADTIEQGPPSPDPVRESTPDIALTVC